MLSLLVSSTETLILKFQLISLQLTTKRKKSIESAKAQVATLTGSQKSLLSARVAAADANRLKAAYYIDGVKFVQNDLAEATAALAEHVEAGEITDETVEVYNNLSATIRKAERVIGKIYGSEVREALQSSYLLDAKFAREAVIYEVSQYELMNEIAEQVADGELSTAADNFKVLERLKVRAVEIKEAGRALYPNRTDVYPDLPSIETQLRTAEAAVVASYEDKLAPVVKSVSAINATQVEVTFNKELAGTDFDTLVEAQGIFSISTETLTGAQLSSDKKTVTLTFSNTVEGTNKELIVEPVTTTKKDNNNQPVKTEKYVQVFTYEDTSKPEILEVTAKTKNTVATSVTVKASEPIASVGVVKIDGQVVTANFGGTNTAVINGVNLDASKQHTVEFINLTDKAATPNVTVSGSKAFSVTVDAEAPSVSVSTASEKEILLTFSKPMNATTVTTAFASNSGNVKKEDLVSVGHSSATVVPGTNNTQFKVAVTDTLFTNSTSRKLTVLIPNTVEDSLGNKVALTTTQVTLTKDVTKPAATGYKLIKDNNGNLTDIVVEFSEALATNANPDEPTIVNANGVLIPASSFLGGLTADAITAGDKTVTYSVASPGKPSGKLAFSFGSELVSDLAETANKSEAFSYTIDFGANTNAITLPTNSVLDNSTADRSADATNAPTSSNVFVVKFPAAVRGGGVSNSATDVANYTLNGSALPSGTKITLNSAQTIATITLPSTGAISKDDTAVIALANIHTLDGRTINAYQEAVVIADNTKPVLNSAVVSNGDLVFGFSEDVSNVDASDFEFTINNTVVSGYAVNAITSGSEKGKYSVTFSTVANSGKLYLDVDGNGTYTSADTVELGTTTAADGTTAALNLSSGLITGLKVKVVDASDIVDASAANNAVTTATVITVK